MIAHTAKVMPILSSVLVLIGIFLTSCVGINLGDTPRGLRHPRGVPSVDPSTLGRKILYAPRLPQVLLQYLYLCSVRIDSLHDLKIEIKIHTVAVDAFAIFVLGFEIGLYRKFIVLVVHERFVVVT